MNQHFVGQFYVRGFLDPVQEAKGQKVLWLYEKNRFPSRKSTKNVGYEEYYYDIGVDSTAPSAVKEPGYIEKALHVLEDLAVPILRKLSAGDIGLTPKERGEFAGFMALSMCRTPVYMQIVDKMAVNYHMASLRFWQEYPNVFEKLIREAANRTVEQNDYRRRRELQ